MGSHLLLLAKFRPQNNDAEKIEWDKVDMKDEIGVPILIIALGAAGIVLL